MNNGLKIKMYTFTMDCKNPHALAKFYAALLNWDAMQIDDGWACVYAPGTGQGGYPGILFQQNPDYIPPVWPAELHAQQQMAHIDFAVNNLEEAVQHALHCGAVMATEQFSDAWRVMLDPAGHPFCLCEMKAVMESPHFSLL